MKRTSASRHFLPGGLLLLLAFIAYPADALTVREATQLLRQADKIKTSNHAQFVEVINRLDRERAQLPAQQLDYLRYLKGWKNAYDGDYEAAIPRLKALLEGSRDMTLRFRAGATLVNLLAVAARYQDAFAQLSTLLQMLPQVTDRSAREQGLLVAATLYNEVGQYDLSLTHSQTLLDEGQTVGALCKGTQVRLRALYESGKLRTNDSTIENGIATCEKAGEFQYSNWIRTYAAKLYMRQEKHDVAINLLKSHYHEARQTQYPRLISAFDALMAQAYRDKGEPPLALQSALNAVDNSVKDAYTEPLVTAYQVLYQVSKQQGDVNAALAFHEKFSEADKGYLDDVSARQLAYERVKHESIASKLQIEGLNKQNQVLQLERALGAKAVENSRLYIVLLLTVLLFMMLWFYKTKRLQLHFMNLSQKDSLTGIANRHHFINQAEAALAESKKNNQELCIILCDLDHFKSINDRHGHHTGDAVLQHAVSACQAHLRAGDAFGRFGGEEFVILLPGCDLDTARQRSEQLRAAIQETAGKQGELSLNVSASFGVASARVSGYDLHQLLVHADTALFQAKRAGRNRVMHYDASAPSDGLLLDINDRLRGVGA